LGDTTPQSSADSVTRSVGPTTKRSQKPSNFARSFQRPLFGIPHAGPS
jgi:hypothetical protein